MKKIILFLVATILALPTVCAQSVILDKTAVPKTEKPENPAYSAIPKSGYSGLVGVELSTPGPYGSSAFGITTTHGAMLTERHFLGGGIGLVKDFADKRTSIPIYAEGRLYFLSQNNNIYPNIALRAGAMVSGRAGTGFYGTLTGGIRIPFSHSLGLLAEVGPALMPKYTHEGLRSPYKVDGTKIGFYARISFMF